VLAPLRPPESVRDVDRVGDRGACRARPVRAGAGWGGAAAAIAADVLQPPTQDHKKGQGPRNKAEPNWNFFGNRVMVVRSFHSDLRPGAHLSVHMQLCLSHGYEDSALLQHVAAAKGLR